MIKYIAAIVLIAISSAFFINQDKFSSKLPVAGTAIGESATLQSSSDFDKLTPAKPQTVAPVGKSSLSLGSNKNSAAPANSNGAYNITLNTFVDGKLTKSSAYSYPYTGYDYQTFYNNRNTDKINDYKFIKWGGVCTGTKGARCGFTIQGTSGSAIIELYWKRTTYNLTAKVEGKGNIKSTTSIKEDKIVPYDVDTKVSLTAPAAKGYFFSSWGGDCSIFKGNPVCNIVMNSDKTVSAIFKSVKQLCAKTDMAKGKGLKKGKIIINNKEYEYNTGGWGDGEIPLGTYTVSNCRTRTKSSMSVDGFGFSCDLTDGTDPKTGKKRVNLRIHPDGGVCGTEGCIGITGNSDTQKNFYNDMTKELNESGGTCELVVGE